MAPFSRLTWRACFRSISDIEAASYDRLLRVGCRPSPVTKAAVQAEYRINGSNQRDTGHWIWSAPPAAMADDLPVMAG